MGSLVLPEHISGFEGVAYGGYAAGVFAALATSHRARGTSVSFRSPPLVGRSLRYEHLGDRVRVFDQQLVVADVEGWSGGLDIPVAPTASEAAGAEARFPGHRRHAFPRCFGCGPDRGNDKGLRLFTGPVEGRDLVAATWCPQRWTADGSDRVAAPFVWAALDCPGAWAHLIFGPSRGRHVTVRLSAAVVAQVVVGLSYVVIGWLIGGEGRKRLVGSAIFDPAGDVCAYSEGLWLAITEPNTPRRPR